MQFSQKTFGSQNAIKQLYRQYSTTFKNNEIDKNKTMTQSSNLPFDKIYNAFNSTGHMKNFTLDHFKHSQAKSIIQKLMQTKQLPQNNKQNDFLLLNQIQNLQGFESKEPIPLGETQNKIFCQVVNLMSEIAEIKQKTQKQNEQFNKLKVELKNEGIQFPQIQEKKNSINKNTFRIYTSQQLQKIFEQNQNLQAQIQKSTKQLTNKNQQQKQSTILQSIIKENSILKKELLNVKSEIINAGQIDDQDMIQLNFKIQELKKSIYILEQKRLGKLSDKDQELRSLKNQNQKLRLKTIEILKYCNQPINNKKAQLIRTLKFEEQQKQYYLDQMNFLKAKFEAIASENQRLKREVSNKNGGYYYEGPLQVQSKVSPFQNTYGQYQSAYGYDKQNYIQNFQPQRNRSTLNNNVGYGKYESKYNSEGLRNYLSNQNASSYSQINNEDNAYERKRNYDVYY